MISTISKWGNSQGVHLPKSIVEENKIITKKTDKRKHISLKDRLKDYNSDYKVSECDTGAPVGRELF